MEFPDFRQLYVCLPLCNGSCLFSAKATSAVTDSQGAEHFDSWTV